MYHRCNGRGDIQTEEEYRKFCRENLAPTKELALALLQDLRHRHPTIYRNAEYMRDKDCLSRRIDCEGIVFLTKTLPNLFQEVLNFLETGHASYSSFGKKKDSAHPRFLGDLLRYVHSRTVDDKVSTEIMRSLYQFCVAFKKLKGPYLPKVLESQLFQLRWVDGEIFDHPQNVIEEIIISRANDIIKAVFKDFNIDHSVIRPRPGPGATNTPTKKAVRYRPHVLYDQIEQLMPSKEWHVPLDSEPLTYFDWYVGMKPVIKTEDPAFFKELPRKAEPTSRFKFVFKEFGKPRGICIEELEMQWRQQALRRYLYKHLESHEITRGYVNFKDQSINGDLALEASKRLPKKSLATIDMSDASNRVSKKLVYALFRGTAILPYLEALSTNWIDLPNGKTFKCNMFAPMGSAICFPIMALCHFVLIKAIISLLSADKKTNTDVYVYGDDILIHPNHVKTVYQFLPKFGMKINQSKSYFQGRFRESCGTNAFNGQDITPTRIKYVLVEPLSCKALCSVLANEAELYKKGFAHTASVLRQHVCKFVKGYIPFIGPNSPLLGFRRPHGDFDLKVELSYFKSRWHAGLHRKLYKSRVFSLRSVADAPPSEEELYLRKQVEFSQNARKIDELPEGDMNLQWRWLPDSLVYGAQELKICANG